jgi:hypothetical protein
MFKSVGDLCTPTEDEMVENADEETYKISTKKQCVPTICVSGYTFDKDSLKCSVSTTTESLTESLTETPSEEPTSYVIPVGEKCESTSNIEHAADYRLDNSGNCKLAECLYSYKINNDGTACVPDPSAGGTAAYNCTTSFGALDQFTCRTSGDAGIKWTFDKDGASGYCKAQVQYYEVTVTSDYDPVNVFKTRVPPQYTSIGITGLPTAYFDTNLTFTVMPIDKKGKKMLLAPLEINAEKLGTTKSCPSVGIAPQDAYKIWNYNENIFNVHWHKGYGNFGYFKAYKGDQELQHTGKRTENEPHRTNLVKGTSIEFGCYDGIYGPERWDPEEIKRRGGNNSIYITNTCWAGNPRSAGGPWSNPIVGNEPVYGFGFQRTIPASK